MPTNKHKRKATSHAKPKIKKTTGLISLHPKGSFLVGLLILALSVYLLIFKSQDNAMFGLAMISLISGAYLAIFAQMALTKNNKHQ